MFLPYFHNLDDKHGIINAVDDSVVAKSDLPTVGKESQFFGIAGTRIFGQSRDDLPNLLPVETEEPIDLSAYMPGNFKPILAHLPPTSR